MRYNNLVLLVFFLFAFVSSSLLQRVTKHTPTEHSNSLPTRRIDDQSISPLISRSLGDWDLTSILVVSDIEGNLHGLNRNTGAFLWTLENDEPLAEVNEEHFADKKEAKDSNVIWLVEPYEDGSLYYFSPSFGLNRLPSSIKNLVMKSPFSLSGDDKIYTGSRKTSLFSIDVLTGQIIKQFGTLNDGEVCCIDPMQGQHTSSDIAANLVLMGKTTYELKIFSKSNSNLVWNVTYSYWGPNNIDNDLISQNKRSLDRLYCTPFHDKSVLAISQDSGAPLWVSRLPSLAVNVFDVFSKRESFGENVLLPHPSKEFNSLQHSVDGPQNDKYDLCFVNKTNTRKQWFAMSYKNFPTLIKSAPTSTYQSAVYRFEGHQLDEVTAQHMRNFNVKTPDSELIVKGVHKFKYLSPLDQYQPTQKFVARETKQIGDGSFQSSLISSEDICPNILEGLSMISAECYPQNDMVTVDHLQDLSLSEGPPPSYLPVRYNSDSDSAFIHTQEPVTMLRRIMEDLFVMSILLSFFLCFAKFNKLLKSRKLKSDNPLISEKKDEFVSQIDNTDIDKSNPTVDKKLDDVPKSTATDSTANIFPLVETNENSEEYLDSSLQETRNRPMVGEDADATDLMEKTSLTKKKRKRGNRSGNRGAKSKKAGISADDQDKANASDDENSFDPVEGLKGTSKEYSVAKTSMRESNPFRKIQIDNNLVISDRILGYGSHGTVVYEGTFENRPVAVKRMLLDFYDIANHEVRVLQESDTHPNVIRYYCSQSSEKEKFLYIALELCVCSLEQLIEPPRISNEKFRINLRNRNQALQQLASGLDYLHSLKIVHRDLKPQNILLGAISEKMNSTTHYSPRLLISDFGLCKKLEADQSSFGITAQHSASGTSGWRAPELLLQNDLTEISPETIHSTESLTKFGSSNMSSFTSNSNAKRLTKAIDVFSLGCVFYYILSNGQHPFGDRYLREGNIIKGKYDLSYLQVVCPHDYVEATQLVSSMISFCPKDRPDTQTILKHPFFWSPAKKLEFLLKVSDRFEVERRDPPSDLLANLEKVSFTVHNGDWLSKFDTEFIENLGKYRKYHSEKVMDLLRALRNKYHHYNDMPTHLQAQMSPLPSGFYTYFSEKFPSLLMEVFTVVRDHLSTEHIFEGFF